MFPSVEAATKSTLVVKAADISIVSTVNTTTSETLVNTAKVSTEVIDAFIRHNINTRFQQ